MIAELTVDSSGLVYHCSQYGVTLIIPEGAVQQPTTVWYGACLLSDRFKFEGDHIPVSPIVWIYIGSQLLLKPAELYIPHHIDTTKSGADVFLLTSEDYEFEKSNYLSFIQNSKFRFSLDSTVVQITSSQFCSNCIATYGRHYREVPKRYYIARADKKQPDGTLVVEFIFIYQQIHCKKVRYVYILFVAIHTTHHVFIYR